ncbi:MAG: NAD(P)-binding domain-containing protein [Pseudomonadota bacterium]
MEDLKIGVIGCGQMGRPMAEAMLGASLDVRGFDIRPRSEFDGFARHLVPTAQELGDCDTLISIVRDIPQTERALFETGLVHSPALRRVVISSTVSPRYIQDLSKRVPPTVALIDAPMSGAPIAAQSRKLSFMLGGDPTTLDKLMPAFQAMGTTHHRLGPLGAGMTAKVLNNLIAASSVVATRMALDWGTRLGAETEALRKVFHTSSGQTWFGSNFHDITFAREGYDPENTMGILRKDVESARDAAPQGTPLDFPDALIAAIRALEPFALD